MLMWHHSSAFGPTLGEKVEDTTTLALDTKTTKDKKHFSFLSSPRHEPMIGFGLEN